MRLYKGGVCCRDNRTPSHRGYTREGWAVETIGHQVTEVVQGKGGLSRQ